MTHKDQRRPEPTRDEIRSYWEALAGGRRTPAEVGDWAEAHLAEASDVKELVLQGLLTLQAFRFAPRADRDSPLVPRKAGPDPEIAKRLRAWLDELAKYDADPDAWTTAYFRRSVRSFAERHGTERARAFGTKLVKSGQLTPADVDDALSG